MADRGGVSESVLFAVERALQLDEAESAHLFACPGPIPGRGGKCGPWWGQHSVPHPHHSDLTDQAPVVGEITLAHETLVLASSSVLVSRPTGRNWDHRQQTPSIRSFRIPRQ